MNTKDFFTQFNNKKIDFDGYYGAQCMDLYRQYCKNVLDIPQSPSVNGAAEVWNSYLSKYFVKITNTITGVPKEGDIIVWNKQLNGYGHIAICQSANVWNFTSFDQNFPIGSKCHFQKHNYKNVLGWLRLKRGKFKLVFINPPSNIKEFISRVNGYTKGNLELITSSMFWPIEVESGTLTTEKATNIIKAIPSLVANGVFLFYPRNMDSAYEVASYYPERNMSFATIPTPIPTSVMIHAFLHLLRKYINFNKLGPYIEDIEKYPSTWSDMANIDNVGWKFEQQYSEIPYHYL